MKEYWVNVYQKKYSEIIYLGNEFIVKRFAIGIARCQPDNIKCIYRIHVKMDGGFNKREHKYNEFTVENHPCN